MPLDRPHLSAHVATDYTSGTSRVFIFTPVDSGFKSHAVIQLDENGNVTGHRSTVRFSRHSAALARWAAIYQRRSIPANY